MSVYSISRIKQFMDCLVNQAVSPLIAESEVIERAISWLQDEESKEQFRRELVFMVLRPLLKDDAAAIRYAGNIQMDEWERILQKVQIMRGGGGYPQLPNLAYPESESWVIPYMYASLFVLEQYAYKDLITIKNGDIFLDCGACCGETSVWAVNKGAGKVYAFEPNPQSMKFLEKNAQKYGQNRRPNRQNSWY